MKTEALESARLPRYSPAQAGLGRLYLKAPSGPP